MNRRKVLGLTVGATITLSGCLSEDETESDTSGETEEQLTEAEQALENYLISIRDDDEELFRNTVHEEGLMQNFDPSPTLEILSITERTIEETVQEEIQGTDIPLEDAVEKREQDITSLVEEFNFEEAQYVKATFRHGDNAQQSETLLLVKDDNRWQVMGVLFRGQST